MNKCLKSKTTIIILILLIASVILTTNTTVNAQTTTAQPVSGPLASGTTANVTVKTNAYLSFRPNPVGLNQPFLVNLWVTPACGSQRKFLDFTVTITKPDNTQEVITMDSYVDDGTAWFEYIADQVGTWKLKFDFLGMYYPTGTYDDGEYLGEENTAPSSFFIGAPSYYASCYFEPSSTAEQTLTVQEEPVASWPESPLPTDYWTRPVAYEHREWSLILGDYPWKGIGGGANWPEETNIYSSNYEFTPYVQAPNSAHVAWKRQFAIAGILGGDYGHKITDADIFGDAAGYNPTVIYAGRAYQTITKPINGIPQTICQCYDIRTGEVFWEILVSSTTIEIIPGWSITSNIAPTYIEYAQGQLWGGGGASDQAVTASLLYIGSGRLVKWNPMTGVVTTNCSIEPLTSGTYYMNGYALSVQNTGTMFAPNYQLINWSTAGTTNNFTQRIISNISWPISSLPSCIDYETGVAAVESTISKAGAYVGMNAYAINLKTGAVLWNITKDDIVPYSTSCDVADHGKFAILTTEGYYVAYDLLTGEQAWKSETMDYPWDESGFGAYSVQSAYGLFYRQAYSGIYAFDWDDGSIAWKFEAPANAYETPYINENGTTVFSWNIGAKIADGKLYTYTTEHSATVPITRGWGLYCINATSGEGIWNVMLPGASSKHSTDIGAIADGYLTVFGSDGYMYVYGKGQSKTTIEAPLIAIPIGESVLIEGTVLDQSPAQTDTACVSKESMGAWMEYLHKQLNIPEDVTGVSVSLDAVDPNGNFIHIGDVTTDGYSGTFGFAWQPEITGKYTVTATFMGDDSYGSSFATTYVNVVEAQEEPPTTSPITFDAVNSTVVTVVIAGVVAMIMAVAVATVLILRKRP